ncbi:MAG: DUF5103 domain-containing protein [Cytophagales bacterium]|nr:DUF5103 domain-containing protein [Cytophagales bacterium]
MRNATYESYIKSVQLYPNTGQEDESLDPSVLRLGDPYPLRLSFDDLADKHEDYYTYFIPCDEKWKEIPIPHIDFIQGNNDFQITNFTYYTGTAIPYVHYTQYLPPITRAGNYVLVVYRRLDKEDIVLSRRLMIVRPELQIKEQVVAPFRTEKKYQNTHHQLNLKISYDPNSISSPVQTLKIYIRQNYRWDKVVHPTRPSRVGSGSIEFDILSSILFPSPRAFRGFDIRPSNFRGKGVARVEQKNFSHAYLYTDRDISSDPYIRQPDLNGRYLLAQKPKAASLKADYFMVSFTLKTPKQKEDVYLLGSFNSFVKDPMNRMIYQEETTNYTQTLYLKQGYYDYVYETSSGKSFSGYFFQSQQVYEVFIYYKPLQQPQNTELIGYKRFTNRP